MGNNNLRLEPQPVFSAILEGEHTFMELAKKYGLDVKEFERLLREKVGDKDFTRLQKASKQNWLKKRHKTKKTEVPSNPVKREKMIPTRSELLEQQEEAGRRIQELTSEVEKEELKLDKANAKVAEAETMLRMAQKESKSAKERFIRKMQKLEKWTKKSQEIAGRLQQIESQIYLIAPGYKGALPDAGKLISVIPFEGAENEVGGELLNETTAEDLLNSGFELISEARNAYDFARLVIKYQFNEIEAKILVDDERIVQILKEQGLEV